VIWNLTGGVDGGVHTTDVTNASRTLLMDIRTLEWREDIAEVFGIPTSMLPEIKPSSGEFGVVHDSQLLREVPITGVLGDQQSATFGQAAFEAGESKNTYGTGCFLIFNTGEEVVESKNGLLTTVGYKLGDEPTHYALEGSIAVAGSLVQWLRDNLRMIDSAPEIEELAKTVDDNGGAFVVPAFSGLYAPYWRPDARGAIVGLTRYVNRGHIARAVQESTAYQTADVMDAVNKDSGVPLTELRVDGGMTANEDLMQFQADILGVDVVRPAVTETTALGAAYAAGLAVGYWSDLGELKANWAEGKRWSPNLDEAERERLLRLWHKAVTKSFDWVDDDVR
jgi:glycerol kinase